METVLAHAGPAALLDATGQVLEHNDPGRCLAILFAHPGLEDLRVGVRECLARGAPVTRLVRGAGLPDGPDSLDILLLPAAEGDRVAALARDTSLDSSLQAALTESRARFKDFVALSSDFSWETGPDGRLVFVSPPGALGREARDMVGGDPLDLLDDSARAAGETLFQAQRRVRDLELWARDRRGRRVRLLASAMPMSDPHGGWIGARGICRDITEQHVRDLALRRAQERDRVRSHVVRTFRDQVDVETMLTVAAEALALGVGAAACQILRRPIPGHTIDVAALSDQGPCEDLIVGGQFGLPPTPPPLAALTRALGGDLRDRGGSPASWEGQVDDHALVVIGTSYRQQPNGALVLWRLRERGGWTPDDRMLILDVAGQVGIANEQIARYETVIDMSRTDSLTGLMNRRAFMQDAERRMRRLERSQRPAALMYVDLDNFKLVNDLHGHARGDQVLVMLADILRTHIRPTDLVGRLGGDEFAVWLEDADDTVACQKANDFLNGSVMLGALSASTEAPLAMSIGIAVTGPGLTESLEAFCARADSAMYTAKQSGKGRFHLCQAGAGGTACLGEPGP
nr:sensor domain-containing diguanylate cyclase [Roseospira navarrensis]